MQLNKEELEIIEFEKIEKRKLTREFMRTKLFKKYLEPYIKNRIKQYKNIAELKEENLTESFLKNKMRVAAWQSVLSFFNSWSTIEIEGGGDSGREKN